MPSPDTTFHDNAGGKKQLDRFIKVFHDNGADLTLFEKISCVASEDGKTMELSGVLVVAPEAEPATSLFVTVGKKTEPVPFTEARTPKFRKKYPTGVNSEHARLQGQAIAGGKDAYKFSLGKDGVKTRTPLFTVYDRKFLKASKKLTAVREKLAKTNCKAKDAAKQIAAIRKSFDGLSDADKMTETFAECVLLLRGLELYKPWETQGKINDLQIYYNGVGKSDQFEPFIAAFKSIIAPHALTNHGFTTTFETLEDHDVVWNNLSETLKRIESSGYQVFLSSGTLLGAYRDGRLIEFDDDVDLGIMLKATNIDDVIEEWKELKTFLQKEGLLEEEGVGVYKLPNIMGFQIDLFPAWCSNGKAYLFPYCYGKLKKADVLPLKTWGPQKLHIPNNPDAVLSVNYDDNWKVPDPYFRFDWKSARKAFKTFVQPLRQDAKAN